MDICLLCLQNNIRYNEYITINSSQWFQFRILEKIEKHLWPIDSMQNSFGICSMCWTKLNDFDKFYRTIENAHQKNVKISKEEIEILQLNSPQNIKADIPSIGEPNYKFVELHNIKTEGHLEDDESIVCVSMGNMQSEIDFHPILTEKRKRGRPKKYNIYESFTKNSKGEVCCKSNLTKAPKGKRGRPRKINKIIKTPNGKRGRPRKYALDINAPSATYSKVVSDDINPSDADLVHQHIPTHTQESFQLSALGKGSPQKVKRSRGRPRKIPITNDGHNSLKVVHELAIKEEPNTNQQCAVQVDGKTNEIIVNSNNARKLTHTKNLFSLMKKRKQRRALMRNYIATSVLCMKFLKKD